MIASINGTANVQGFSFVNVFSADYPTAAFLDQTLPVGVTGSLTTRTDDNTGTVTMTSVSHGIATGNRVSVSWLNTTTGLIEVQYKVTVGTVAGTSVPIDLGLGVNLPVATTAVVVAREVVYDLLSELDTLKLVAVTAALPAQVVLENAGGTVGFVATIQAADKAYIWTTNSGITIPVTTDVVKAFVANCSSLTVNRLDVALANAAP